MEPADAPPPIGMTELLAGLAALVFGVLAIAGMLAVAAGDRTAAVAPTGPPSAPRPGEEYSCTYAPRDPISMRLGRIRVYASPGDVTLDPAPFSLTPAISGPDAYRSTHKQMSGCDTEELLAYYSSSDPPVHHLLAWVFVTSVDCPAAPAAAPAPSARPGLARQECVSLSPVDATSGVPLPTRVLALGG